MLTKSLAQRAITAIATIAIGSAFAASAAHATILAPLPNPFPQGSGFDLNAPSGICVGATECTHDIYITNLVQQTYSPIANGAEEQFTANFSATFANPSNGQVTATANLTLVPGTFFTVDIKGGYNPYTNAIGTFPETLVAASFEGTDSLGNVITAALASTPSTGSVTIAAATGGGFDITNTFTINAQSTVNGTPITVPPLGASNIAAPEPASLGLLAVSMIGTVVARRRRRSF
jgi:hypothetical protein